MGEGTDTGDGWLQTQVIRTTSSPTEAPTNTPTAPPTKAPYATVKVAFTLDNVDFAAMTDTQKDIMRFKVIAEIAKTAKVDPSMVSIKLSAGSLQVTATISANTDSAASAAKYAVYRNSDTLKSAVQARAKEIRDLPTTGAIRISGFSTSCSGNVANCDKIKDDAEEEVEAVNRDEDKGEPLSTLMYWTFGMGMASGVLIALVNSRLLVRGIFSTLSKMGESVDRAFTNLNDDLEIDVKGALQAYSGGGMVHAAGVDTSARGLAGTFEKSIEEYRKDVKVEDHFPPYCHANGLVIGIASVLVLIVIIRNTIGLVHTAQGTANTLAIFGLPFELWINVAINFVIGFVGSWPMVRFCTNSTIVSIQNDINEDLSGHVKGSIPGGVQNLQSVMDSPKDPFQSGLVSETEEHCRSM